MLLSVIIPFYNEEKQVTQTLAAVQDVLLQEQRKSPDFDYELLLIDDGSQDQTWARLTEAAQLNPRLRLFSFSRNFGKEAALCAGLDHAAGDCCIVMDGDLQFPPRYIPQMLDLWRQGYEIVDGVKRERQKEKGLARLAAQSFYRIFRATSGYELQNASDFKLLDRRVVNAWRSFGERDSFFRGLSAWLGFRRTEMPFEVAERQSGESKWHLRSLWRLSVNAIWGFSSAPLAIIAWLGAAFWGFALLLGLETLIMKFVGNAESGFTTVILLLLILGGTLMISLALLGAYIARIYTESKGRPRYLISRTEKGATLLTPPIPGLAQWTRGEDAARKANSPVTFAQVGSRPQDAFAERRVFFDYTAQPEQEVVETWLDRGKWRVERIVSTGQTTDWQEQDEEEWVLLLEGEARLCLDRKDQLEEIHLQKGESFLIPAGLRHRVTATSNPTLWLAVFGPSQLS